MNCKLFATFDHELLFATFELLFVTFELLFATFELLFANVKCTLLHVIYSNQACGWRTPDFLELLCPRKFNVGMRVCACVCPPPRLLITSGVMWCDIDPYD